MKFRQEILFGLAVVALVFGTMPGPAEAHFSQQAKLVGTGAIIGTFSAEQGYSVSLSADGNTAIVGGNRDNNSIGAAWVYTRSGVVWSQQGPKLVGTDAVGPAQQGVSVSLSGDGNTAIVGGPGDNDFAGAAWVYSLSGGVWSQQAKLVGTGAVGPSPAIQGASVSLSGTGTPLSLGGIKTTILAQRGFTRARAGYGASKRNSSAHAVQAAPKGRAGLSLSPVTEIPPSSVAPVITMMSVPRGFTRARTACGASKRN